MKKADNKYKGFVLFAILIALVKHVKTLRVILSGFVIFATLLLTFLAFAWQYYEPGLNDELYKFKTHTGNYYTGYVKNPSTWKHADKLAFKSNFENGKVEKFDIKPSCDSFDNKPFIEKSKDTASFSLNRLSTQESFGIEIFVNPSGDLKEDIRLSWGTRMKKTIIPILPGEKEQRIFKAGISAKERENALESDARKVR